MTKAIPAPASPAGDDPSPLFEPFSIGSMELPNRIVMAPMTREFCPDGVPGGEVAEYYARRAANGVGLIITEATDIDHPSSWGDRTGVPRFFGADALAGWSHVVESVHAAGGRIIPQLWHVGSDRQDGKGQRVLGPSGVTPSGDRSAVVMTDRDIDDVIASFARAAADAQRLGFDGIELQGAHGFLIDQFLWERTNSRSDRYGGDAVARTRFAAEVVDACREATSNTFPIIMRISQWKVADFTAQLAETPEDLEEIVTPLVEAGVGAFHCSTRRFWRAEFPGSDLNLAGWVKKVSGKPTITVGSVGLADSDFMTLYTEGAGAATAGLEHLTAMLRRGDFDLVAVGRALLGDAEWAAKIRDGRHGELMPFEASMVATLT
ncbi:NADH:flavin oxidoreductase [Streptomyces sp. cg2]|uniref:NADH:flavin oxidoreductase n=1 Tax=Streptomyces sp. cg2 TaxID=3238799 RepID=UPI0034E2AAEE